MSLSQVVVPPAELKLKQLTLGCFASIKQGVIWVKHHPYSTSFALSQMMLTTVIGYANFLTVAGNQARPIFFWPSLFIGISNGKNSFLYKTGNPTAMKLAISTAYFWRGMHTAYSVLMSAGLFSFYFASLITNVSEKQQDDFNAIYPISDMSFTAFFAVILACYQWKNFQKAKEKTLSNLVSTPSCKSALISARLTSYYFLFANDNRGQPGFGDAVYFLLLALISPVTAIFCYLGYRLFNPQKILFMENIIGGISTFLDVWYFVLSMYTTCTVGMAKVKGTVVNSDSTALIFGFLIPTLLVAMTLGALKTWCLRTSKLLEKFGPEIVNDQKVELDELVAAMDDPATLINSKVSAASGAVELDDMSSDIKRFLASEDGSDRSAPAL